MTSPDSAPTSAALARRLWRDYVRPRAPRLSVAVVLMAITAAAAASYAWVVKEAVDLFDARDARILWLAPAAIVAVAAIRSVSLYFQVVMTNGLALKIMQQLQETMFARLMAADYARIAGESVGSLVSRFTNDVTLLREALVRAANNLIRDSLTVIATLGVMFYLDWMLTLLIVVVYPIAFYPVIRIGAALRRVSNEAQVQMGHVTSFLEESLSGARLVKTYGLQEQEQRRANAAFLERFRLSLSLFAGKARVDPILEVVGGLAAAGVIAFAGWRTLQGAATVGDLVGFVAALGVMAPAIRAIGTLSAVAQEGFAALDRIFALMDERPAIQNAPDAKALTGVKGRVSFDDVAFAYGDGAPALNGVTLAAEPGEMIALVGPSGAGKSTILNLIPRLYEATGGAVRIDGHDVRDVTIETLRAHMALVSQSVTLFDASIRDNIAFGRPGAADADIEAAAIAAAAHDFIAALPEGYNAPAGARGERLSGGERQRIALARAFLKDAPILLLDEATSALDAESERQVQAALHRLSSGRTTLVIAHRLSTVRDADRIYVLDAGKVVETGAHDALMEQGGLYAELARLQFREG